MVVLIQSLTLPFNPPGAEPVLNMAQIWEALLLKCRKPQDFLSPMSGSEVLEETETTIKRSVTFKQVLALHLFSNPYNSLTFREWALQAIKLEKTSIFGNPGK